MKTDLGNCTLELLDQGSVVLHIKSEETLLPEDVYKIFHTIHTDYPTARTLIVTAGKRATLSPEARVVVSGEDITEQIVADAIIIKEFSHQMSSNFFVRFNRPSRPTKLFRNIEDAKKWLKKFDEEEDDEID